MSFNSEGIEELKLQLRRLGSITDVTNAELRHQAVKMRDMARNMAPIDYGDLREAITIRETAGQGAGGRFVKGVRNFEVYVNNDHPVSEEKRRQAGHDTVGSYAWLVHEYMGYGSVVGQINPSAESIAAGHAAGVDAGGLYMERAAEAMEIEVLQALTRVVRKYTEALDM